MKSATRTPLRRLAIVFGVVAVALANKTARIAWAVMLRQKEYQPRAVAA